LVDRPYLELNLHDGSRLRTFDPNVADEELVWHRDKRDRRIIVMEGYGWELQMDNEEPIDLLEGHSYTITKMEYHRLIKGTDTLVLRILEV
jgi:hypothetical protein